MAVLSILVISIVAFAFMNLDGGRFFADLLFLSPSKTQNLYLVLGVPSTTSPNDIINTADRLLSAPNIDKSRVSLITLAKEILSDTNDRMKHDTLLREEAFSSNEDSARQFKATVSLGILIAGFVSVIWGEMSGWKEKVDGSKKMTLNDLEWKEKEEKMIEELRRAQKSGEERAIKQEEEMAERLRASQERLEETLAEVKQITEFISEQERAQKASDTEMMTRIVREREEQKRKEREEETERRRLAREEMERQKRQLETDRAAGREAAAAALQASLDAHRGVGEEMNKQAKDKEKLKESSRQAFALSMIPDVAKRALE